MMVDNSPRAALNFCNDSTARAGNQGLADAAINHQGDGGFQVVAAHFRTAKVSLEAQKKLEKRKNQGDGNCHAAELRAYRMSFIREMNGG
jgi:hypothetical protein